MTAIAEIITQAMVYIDDIRLQEQLAVNPALFYRHMSEYIDAAMPLLSSPPQLLDYVNKEYTAPEYNDLYWTSTDESTEGETVLSTEYIGYDLCSIVSLDSENNATAYSDAVYNSETGEITFPQQLSSGINYEIDFYKDGEVADLTPTMKRLFAQAVVIVWDERFSNPWLAITQKIKDSSFQTVNESTYMDKLTNRQKENRQRFQDELRKYEQNSAYKTVVSPYQHKVTLV